MPSHAADALWHVMLQYPIQYQQLCEQTIGRTLNHSPYDGTTRPEERCSNYLKLGNIAVCYMDIIQAIRCNCHDYLRLIKCWVGNMDNRLNWRKWPKILQNMCKINHHLHPVVAVAVAVVAEAVTNLALASLSQAASYWLIFPLL